jgi:sulfur carrier protein ThiS
MKITVEFVGPISIGPYEREQEFDVEKGTSVEEFLKTLKHFHPSHIPYIQVLCNRVRCSHTKILEEGDKLELMIMVGGG